VNPDRPTVTAAQNGGGGYREPVERNPAYELAQVNIARLLEPLDSPRLADFVAQLDPVNALAEAAPGFLWRLIADGGPDATSLRIFDDDWLIVNASVWKSPQHLWDFVYSDGHRAVLRRRREWFERLGEAVTALWWVPAGHRPAVAEDQERLTHLRKNGPSQYVFGLNDDFPPPGVD
jgi:uncharacterized protein DUF3291